MSTINLDKCDCDCHYTKGIMHVMACCWKCPVCERNIKPRRYESHIDMHDKELELLVGLPNSFTS